MHMSTPELPGYEVLEKLGDDGTMTLWKARQLSLDRFVAIKVLPVDSSTNAQSLAQFRREAQAAAKLKNPGIVQIFDAGEFGNLTYIVMEYIAGGTVQEQLNLLKIMREDEAMAIVQWVSLALQYAWNGHQIIHCDIKPENIILSETGDVRVGNLGIAQIINAMSSDGADGDFIGTPNYASPEYVGGKETLDCRTDIYSLGATFYQLVTGVLPFDGLDPSAVLEQQLLGHLDDPRDLNPNLSDSATAILHKMMAKNLADRYLDWKNLLDDLHALKKGNALIHAPCPKGHSTIRLSRPLVLAAPPPPPPPAAAAPAPSETAAAPAKMKIHINKTALAETKTRKQSGYSGCLSGLVFLVMMAGGLYAAARYTPLGSVFEKYLNCAMDYADYYLYGVMPEGGVTPHQQQPASVVEPTSVPEKPLAPPVLAPAPVAPAPVVSAPPPATPAQPADWKSDPSCVKSLQLYKEARGLYDSYIGTPKNQNVQLLLDAEARCREAIDLLKACRKNLPPQAGIQPMIDQCYHLISDCHHARPLDI